MYSILNLKTFYDDIKNIEKNHKNYLKKISIFINCIKENPYSKPYKKLVGFQNRYRYEIGKKFRLIVDIEDKNLIFRRIGRRKNIYT